MNSNNNVLKIFLLGGTKDSTDIIKFIKNNFKDSYILTTTTTKYGGELSKVSGSDDVISKPLLKNEILDILNKNDFDFLIDATHPFASHITQTAIEVSNVMGISYIRFERPVFDLSCVDTGKLYHVNSFCEAGRLIVEDLDMGNVNVLHFAGANTMGDVLHYVNVENFYPRVLNIESSLEKCEDLGINKDHILFMEGVSSKEENKDLIKKFDAKVIITKESGSTGGLFEKISAANELNINIVLVDRPQVNHLNKNCIVSNLNDMLLKLNDY
jgi:precorrin-6A/cobalt-precorrin-6A reductase